MTKYKQSFEKCLSKIQKTQDAYKFRREITEITSSINSRVRLWKINHSGPGCSFYAFYEWYIFQWNTRVYTISTCILLWLIRDLKIHTAVPVCTGMGKLLLSIAIRKTEKWVGCWVKRWCHKHIWEIMVALYITMWQIWWPICCTCNRGQKWYILRSLCYDENHI